MAAMTNDFSALAAPDSGLWPVSKKPEDKTKGEFVRLVWRELTPDAFTTIQEFDEWFKKTLVPRTIESLGGAQVGRMLLHVKFQHGGVAHFMRWVLRKFTTSKSPQQVAAAAAEPAAKFEGEPEIEQDRIPDGAQVTPYKFPLNVDDVSAWQELLDASAGDEQAQQWYKSMLQQAEQRAADAKPAAEPAAEPAAKFDEGMYFEKKDTEHPKWHRKDPDLYPECVVEAARHQQMLFAENRWKNHKQWYKSMLQQTEQLAADAKPAAAGQGVSRDTRECNMVWNDELR